MCILVLVLGKGAGRRVSCLLMHLRDEDMARPVRPPQLQVVDGGESAVAGPIDARAGGTWFAVDAAGGRAVALTNFRSRAAVDPERVRTRGRLVVEAATGRLLRDAAARPMLHPWDAPVYGLVSKVKLAGPSDGFNLVLVERGGDGAGWEGAKGHLVSNRAPLRSLGGEVEWFDARGIGKCADDEAVALALPADVHCLSNSTLGDRSWPKVAFLEEASRRSWEALQTRWAQEERSTLEVLGDVADEMGGNFFVPVAPSVGEAQRAVDWSPLPPEEELYLERGPFVLNRHRDDINKAEGSRTLSIFAVVDGQQFLLYKSFDEAQLDAHVRATSQAPSTAPGSATSVLLPSGTRVTLRDVSDSFRNAQPRPSRGEAVLADAMQRASLSGPDAHTPLAAFRTPWHAYSLHADPPQSRA